MVDMLLLVAENSCLKCQNISSNWNVFAQNYTKTRKFSEKLVSWEMRWFFGVSLLSRIRVPLWCLSGKLCLFNVKTKHVFLQRGILWVCPLGPVLVSPDCGLFRMVLAALQRRSFLDSDPSSASLSALVWSLRDLPEDFCGICCNTVMLTRPADIPQMLYERLRHIS